MSGLFGSGSTASKLEKYAGIQVDTSVYGHVKVILYGTNRISANLIDYAGFKRTSVSSGGKGGSASSYDYSADVILALCDGGASGIGGVLRVWSGSDCYDLSHYSLTLLKGTRPQSPWSTWTSKYPSRAIGYSGTALICKTSMDLGSSATLPNYNFETKGLLATELDSGWTEDYADTYNMTWEGSAYDALPHAVITDMLTNTYYGMLWTAARLGTLSGSSGDDSYQTYCAACGFVISPSFDTQKAAADHLEDVMTATNSELVWSAGESGMILKVIPYGDTAITANGVTYTPNTTPLYSLSYDDYIVSADGAEDPVEVQRTSTQDVKNSVPVEYGDRLNYYNTALVDVPEAADVSLNGYKKDSSQSYSMITRAAHAQKISTILAQKNVYIRNTYTFKVGWKFILLEPMDLIEITDTITGLNKTVRIVSIEMPEETSEADGITIEAEEWPFGVASAVEYATQIPTGNNASGSVAPAAAIPVIFEPPAQLSSSGGDEVWIGTNGDPSEWGGTYVWVSVDGGNSYGSTPAGTITESSRIGTQTAALATSSTSTDTANTLAVTLSGSDEGTLTTASATAAAANATACYVDGEIICYETATLTGGRAYDLTTLLRGRYGSTIGAHASGASFMFLDDAVLKLEYDSSLVGKTLYVKLQSFNPKGTGVQDLSECTAYSFTPAGLNYLAPPIVAITESSSNSSGSGSTSVATDSVTLTSEGATVTQKVWLTVSWTWPSNYPTPTKFEVLAFTGSDPTNASNYVIPVTDVDESQRSYTVAITPVSNLTINASVRAVYA